MYRVASRMKVFHYIATVHLDSVTTNKNESTYYENVIKGQNYKV